MGYRVDWLKKFMFPVHFMDCWSLYILDTEKKIMMVLDPMETDPSDEMKIKHGPLARKCQQKLCTLFISMTCLEPVSLRPLDGHLCTFGDAARAIQQGRKWCIYRALHPGVQQSIHVINSDPESDRAPVQEDCI